MTIIVAKKYCILNSVLFIIMQIRGIMIMLSYSIGLVIVIHAARFDLMADILIVVALSFTHLPITDLVDVAANGKPIP